MAYRSNPSAKASACLLALILALAASPARANVFEDKGTQLIAEVITNPAAFFYDFQQDLEGTHPLPPGRFLGLQFNLFPSLLPLTYGNISAKYRLHPEGRLIHGLPQFDLIGGYWTMVAATLLEDKSATAADADTKIKDASFDGYYGGFMMTSSLEPRVRMFWGYKFSQLKANLTLNKSEVFLGTPVSSFESGLQEHTLMAGLEHPYAPHKFWSIQLNYGLTNKLITSKVSWYRKWVELGLNIYPEGVLVFHPVVNFHFNF